MTDRRSLAAALFALVLMAIPVLSLLPASEMPNFNINNKIEHFSAYFVLALSAALAFPPRFLPRLLVLLAIYGGLLELGQFLSPGRHPAILDWTANCLGLIAGAALEAMIMRRKLVSTIVRFMINPQHRWRNRP